MPRAIHLIGQTVVLIAGLGVAAGAASAGAASNDGGRKSTNSFNLLYTAAAPHTLVIAPAAAASIAPNQAVVANPYNVPLIQNAGSLRSSR